MVKRKKAQPWDAVFSRIRTRYRSDQWYPEKPTADELDDAERQLGLKLPASYRAFALTFGLGGDLMEMTRLDRLMDPIENRGSIVSRTEWNRTNYADLYADVVTPEVLDLYRRVVVFAWEENREVAFDPGSVTDARHNEYRVYVLPRHDEPRPVGETFTEFLGWLATDSPMVWSLGDDDDDSWIPDVIKHDTTHPEPIEYWPWLTKKKKAPLKRDVKLWLAFNNNTVRDLARAIRTEGRVEAFPILADALEEAGCTNADVLESCRTGDPDIDGVWVLRVLLGEK